MVYEEKIWGGIGALVVLGIAIAIVLIVNANTVQAYKIKELPKTAKFIETKEDYDIYQDGDLTLKVKTQTEIIRLVCNDTYTVIDQTVDMSEVEKKAIELCKKYSNVLNQKDVVTNIISDGMGGYEFSVNQKIENSIINLAIFNYDYAGTFMSGSCLFDNYVVNPEDYTASKLDIEEAKQIAITYIEENLEEIKKTSAAAEEDYFDFLYDAGFYIIANEIDLHGMPYIELRMKSDDGPYVRGCFMYINCQTRAIDGPYTFK